MFDSADGDAVLNSEDFQLGDLVLHILRECDGDRERSRAMLSDYVRDHAEFREAHWDEIVSQWTSDQIRKYSYRIRRKFVQSSGEDKFLYAQGFSWVAQDNVRDWLNEYKTSTGKKLGDCERGDLLEEIQIHRTNEITNRKKADWMEKIVQQVNNGIVRDVLSNQKIDDFYQSAFRA